MTAKPTRLICLRFHNLLRNEMTQNVNGFKIEVFFLMVILYLNWTSVKMSGNRKEQSQIIQLQK